MLTGLHHVGYVVPDLDEAIKFYTETLGMTLTKRVAAPQMGLEIGVFRLGDGYAAVAGERFDAILANLPAHRGHKQDLSTAERFIAGAAQHLRARGAAWFVANRALPYELPASNAFRQVRTAAADGRYKVLHCTDPRR